MDYKSISDKFYLNIIKGQDFDFNDEIRAIRLTLLPYNKTLSDLYIQQHTNKTFITNVQDMLNHYWTLDNYALSICYLEILIGIHRTIKMNNKFIIYFMKLLVNCISLDPSKRLSPEHSLKTFDTMLKQIEISDYKQIIDLL